MTVVERIRELGLLRAAGASARPDRPRRGDAGAAARRRRLAARASSSASLLAYARRGVAAGQRAARHRRAGDHGPGRARGPGGRASGSPWSPPSSRRAGPRRVSPVAVLRVRSDPAARSARTRGWLVVVVVVIGAMAVLLLPGGATDLARSRCARSPSTSCCWSRVLLTPALLAPLARLAGLPFAAVLRLEERLARAAHPPRPGPDHAHGRRARRRPRDGRRARRRWRQRARVRHGLARRRRARRRDPHGHRPGAGRRRRHRRSSSRRSTGVALATPLASFDLAYAGTRLEAVAIRGADFLADGRLDFTAGDRTAALDALDDWRRRDPARRRGQQRLGVGVGDTMAVATSHGLVELQVVGLVARSFPGRTGDAVLVGWADADGRSSASTGADAFAVRYAPGRQADAQPAGRGAGRGRWR